MSASAVLAQRNQAILLAILAIFCFSLMDASVKALTARVGVLPALWVRYAGQMALVLILVAPRLRDVVRTRHPVLQVARSIMLMCATGFFFTSLAFIPLTDAAALMSTNPVLITLGAALFLGERLGIRRVAGIGAALVGAMIVIRPGSEVFSLPAILPLVAATCYSGYVLLTRRVGADEDVWTSLYYTGLVGTVILSVLVPFAWQTPDLVSLGLMALIACAGTLGQLALIRAFTQGEAAMLAPYSYTGLIFAAFWGFMLFSEVPDLWTVVGTLVIASAGIYVWYRETFVRSAPGA
ncbi:DMT family transporter [Arenibacterium halophilum]|uniref:DMT family transporter n=1 Tax=Arenibacterium halophilum TaxID=2583821 RepID=UPI0014870D2A|nr:DMT family transporter [Arenibacterium halophilum]